MHSCLNVLLASLQHRFHSIHSSFLCELVASVRRLLGCWMRSQICLLHKYRLVPEGKAETGSVHWQARQKRRLSKSGTGESFGCNRWLAWVPIVAVRVDILLGVRGSVYIYFSMLPGHTRHGAQAVWFFFGLTDFGRPGAVTESYLLKTNGSSCKESRPKPLIETEKYVSIRASSEALLSPSLAQLEYVG